MSDRWYCTRPGEREFDPAAGEPLPEAEKCSHEECRPGPQAVLDHSPVDGERTAEVACSCTDPHQAVIHTAGNYCGDEQFEQLDFVVTEAIERAGLTDQVHVDAVEVTVLAVLDALRGGHRG